MAKWWVRQLSLSARSGAVPKGVADCGEELAGLRRVEISRCTLSGNV